MKDEIEKAFLFYSINTFNKIKEHLPAELYHIVRIDSCMVEIRLDEQSLGKAIKIMKDHNMNKVAEVMQLSGRYKFNW